MTKCLKAKKNILPEGQESYPEAQTYIDHVHQWEHKLRLAGKLEEVSLDAVWLREGKNRRPHNNVEELCRRAIVALSSVSA